MRPSAPCWALHVSVLVWFALFGLLSAASLPPPSHVLIESLAVSTHPDLVVGVPHPSFSWRLSPASAEQRGVVQTGYELEVSNVLIRPGEGMLRSTVQWASGRVSSNVSLHIRHSGPPLQSDCSYHYRLRYWTGTGQGSEVHSGWARGFFRTALFQASTEFEGQWIGHQQIVMNELRREFVVPSTLSRATLFLAVAGYYELYVQGLQVDSTRRLDPGYTLFESDLLYVSFDLTNLLQVRKGLAAAVGLRLGEGWFSQQQNPPSFGKWHPTYGTARVLFQLNMYYTEQNGSQARASVTSDEAWMGREGTVTMTSPFMGEVYSARKERPGWAMPNFVDPYSLWINATYLPSPFTDKNSTTALRFQAFDPIRAGDAALHIATSGASTGPEGSQPGVQGGNLLTNGTLRPIQEWQVTVGWHVFDLGQNFAGTCTLRIKSTAPGLTVYTQHAEVLRTPGVNGVDFHIPDTAALRGAISTDVYVTRGVDGEQYTPAFTVHGFRYFSVFGLYDRAQIDDISCQFIHSATTLVGNFTSSSLTINQLQHNVQWGQLSNLMSVPTDCPQRDERRGWLGDAALSIDEQLFNFDLHAFYDSWLAQIEVEQGSDGQISDVVPYDGGNRPADPNWGSAYPTIVLALYDHYGNLDTLRRHWPGMRAWIDFPTL